MSVLSQRETLALIPLAQQGDAKARQVLMEGHSALARSVAGRYMTGRQDGEDILQVAGMGLFKAIMRFDPQYGVMFSTYAVPMIAGEIKRFLRDDGPMKVTRSLRELAVKANAVRRDWEAAHGCEITLSQLAKLVGAPAEDVACALDALKPVASLQETAPGSEDGRTRLEHMADPNMSEDKLVDRLLLKQLLDTLNERERKIILLRYFRGRTQTEIAQIIGVSQVQISRIEAKVLKKLRATGTEDI